MFSGGRNGAEGEGRRSSRWDALVYTLKEPIANQIDEATDMKWGRA